VAKDRKQHETAGKRREAKSDHADAPWPLSEQVARAVREGIKDFRLPDWYVQRQREALKQASKTEQDRANLIHALAIRDGLIPPPWAGALLDKLGQPVTAPTRPPPLKPKEWVKRQVDQWRQQNTIPDDITTFGRLLANKAPEAVKKGELTKAPGARHFETLLRPYKLFPPRRTKLARNSHN
jgi:hypothetical protein